MDLKRRYGNGGHDLAGMFWDEMSLAPVETSFVVFVATDVYNNLRCGAVEIEIYTGTSKHSPCLTNF